MTESEKRIKEFLRKFGIKVKKPRWILLAIRHPSSEEPGSSEMERLEFLGDALLEATVSKFLFDRLPGASPSTLSKARAHFLSTENLSKIAESMGLWDVLVLGKGEKEKKPHQRKKVITDCYEALGAAIFLDSGEREFLKFLSPLFQKISEELTSTIHFKDPKAELQEYIQRRWNALPGYRTIKKEGPDHSPVFTVEASFKNFSATGQGSSKKEAEREAARKLLEILKTQI